MTAMESVSSEQACVVDAAGRGLADSGARDSPAETGVKTSSANEANNATTSTTTTTTTTSSSEASAAVSADGASESQAAEPNAAAGDNENGDADNNSNNNNNNNNNESVLCESCYHTAIELEPDDVASCEVCKLRTSLADCRQQISDRNARIAELESQLEQQSSQAAAAAANTAVADAAAAAGDSKPAAAAGDSKPAAGQQELPPSSSASSHASDKPKDKNAASSTGAGTGAAKTTTTTTTTTAAAAAEAAAAADIRPHVITVSDGRLGRLPMQFRRVWRAFWRTRSSVSIEGMAKRLFVTLDCHLIPGRKFHVLWLGGLDDAPKKKTRGTGDKADKGDQVAASGGATAEAGGDDDAAHKEDKAQSETSYLDRLKSLLKKIRDHERCLSITWATLPETAFNAAARDINESMTAWAGDNPWLRILDLRYISRREGTMEVSKSTWTAKGLELVGESLKKFLCEKLELSVAELLIDDNPPKSKQAARKLKARSAGGQTKLPDEDELRRLQEIAKQALLKAGEAVPGMASAGGRKRAGPSAYAGARPPAFSSDASPRHANGSMPKAANFSVARLNGARDFAALRGGGARSRPPRLPATAAPPARFGGGRAQPSPAARMAPQPSAQQYQRAAVGPAAAGGRLSSSAAPTVLRNRVEPAGALLPAAGPAMAYRTRGGGPSADLYDAYADSSLSGSAKRFCASDNALRDRRSYTGLDDYADSAGGRFADSGRGFADSGRGFADSGRGFADSGRGFADSGRGFADSGRGFADSGRGFADSGRSFADSGRSFADSGRSFADSGRSFADSGRGFADSGRGFADSAGGRFADSAGGRFADSAGGRFADSAGGRFDSPSAARIGGFGGGIGSTSYNRRDSPNDRRMPPSAVAAALPSMMTSRSSSYSGGGLNSNMAADSLAPARRAAPSANGRGLGVGEFGKQPRFGASAPAMYPGQPHRAQPQQQQQQIPPSYRAARGRQFDRH